jgi:hypothetical protein
VNGTASGELDVSRAALADALLQVGKRQFVRLRSA